MRVEPIRDKDRIRDCITYLGEQSERDKILFMVGIYTGLRMSDILRLRVEDVYKKKVIRIKQKKTKEYVDIPVHSELKRVLNSYCENKSMNQYLFQHQRKRYNKPIKRDRAYKILNEMADYFDMDRIGTHTLRKTCGYHLYKANANNIGLVMRVLGQKNPASTLNYIGVSDMDIKKGINALSF